MKAEHSSGGRVLRRAGPVGRALRIAVGVLLLGSIADVYAEGALAFLLRSASATVGLLIIYVLGMGGGPIFGSGEGQFAAAK